MVVADAVGRGESRVRGLTALAMMKCGYLKLWKNVVETAR